MKRKIITINEEKCTGCGLCIPNCPEGAIQIINNKARLVSDLSCDGLGACLGHCPEGAITIEEREAAMYDERSVIKSIIKQGNNVVEAHLKHLKDHNELEYLAIAQEVLQEQGIDISPSEASVATPLNKPHATCPGSQSMQFAAPSTENDDNSSATRASHLRHWPIQLHLISPLASHYKGSDLLLAADCSAFSMGDFHRDLLKGKTLAIACPKLDNGKEIYLEKLRSLIDDKAINTLTVVIMEVPCCGSLLHIAKQAALQAKRKVPIKSITIGIDGHIVQESWV